MRTGKYHPWMRDEQIVSSWKEARNRNAQVKILAELNAVPRSVIEEILIAHGCEVEKKQKPPESIGEIAGAAPEAETNASAFEASSGKWRASRSCHLQRSEKKPWTDAVDVQLMELHGEGRSYKEIAEKMERSVAAVKQRIVNLKRKEREKEMNGNSWTSDEVAFMLERRKQGVDVRHIAAEMGRSVPAITSKLKKLREEGKKLAAEIEAEEREETAVPKGTQIEVQKSDSLLDKIMRLVQDCEKAAELAGEADEIHIDATAESVSLRGTGGGTVIYLRETVVGK